MRISMHSVLDIQGSAEDQWLFPHEVNHQTDMEQKLGR